MTLSMLRTACHSFSITQVCLVFWALQKNFPDSYPPPIEQGSDEAKKDDDAALAAKLTHIGSLETWWSKGPEEGKTSDAEVAKIVVEA
mmetsp:Transcript_29239/g.74107  ORF Transcript_29239/g.74107 Transcript_29239/m.74107 type:complete len:88 (-) Transcript_29239:340-603(-)